MSDQTKQVVIDGELVTVPADASDAHISAALNAIPQANAASVPSAKTWAPSDSGALAIMAAKRAAPYVANALESFATNPTLARTASSAANKATTLAGVVHGAVTLNPAQVLAAPKEGWAAGKGAYWLAKGAQGAAAPVASAIDSAKPYMPVLGTLSGVQGGLDLAQMAEPNRKDIGFLGMSTGNARTPEEQAAHPALLNMILGKASEGVAKLVDKGMSAEDALAAWLKGKR